MQIPKPTAADVERFHFVVPADPRVEVKPMFGNLGAFVNGIMFMGLLGSDIGIKLDAAGLAELRALDGAGPFGPRDRPMGGYVTLPPSLVGTPEGARWIARSLDHVGVLPPKSRR